MRAVVLLLLGAVQVACLRLFLRVLFPLLLPFSPPLFFPLPLLARHGDVAWHYQAQGFQVLLQSPAPRVGAGHVSPSLSPATATLRTARRAPLFGLKAAASVDTEDAVAAGAPPQPAANAARRQRCRARHRARRSVAAAVGVRTT